MFLLVLLHTLSAIRETYYIQTETHYTQIMTFYLDVKCMIVTGSIDEVQLFVLIKFNMAFSEKLALLLVHFN